MGEGLGEDGLGLGEGILVQMPLWQVPMLHGVLFGLFLQVHCPAEVVHLATLHWEGQVHTLPTHRSVAEAAAATAAWHAIGQGGHMPCLR